MTLKESKRAAPVPKLFPRKGTKKAGAPSINTRYPRQLSRKNQVAQETHQHDRVRSSTRPGGCSSSPETGIPPSFPGIIHDNPASADAIRAGEAELVKIAERDQVIFGARWCEVANLALHIATGENANQHTLRARWKDASTPTKAAQAQSVMQLVSAGILPPTSEITYELLGYDATTISRLVAEARKNNSDELFRIAAGAARGTAVPEDKSRERWIHSEEL